MSYTESMKDFGSAERKINYAQRKADDALAFIGRFAEATWDQIEASVDAGVYDSAVRRELHADIEVFRNLRWNTLDVERNRRLREFRRDLRRSLLQSLQTIDHLSAVGAHRVVRVGAGGAGWRPWFGQRLVANFERAGFGTITGPPQKGKTNIGLYMGEQFAAKDPQRNVVLSNIRVFNPPSWYHPVNTLAELFRAIVGIGPRNREGGGFNPGWDPGLADLGIRWLWVFDEGGVTWKKKKATSNTSSILETVAKHLGKNSGNILFIEQTQEGIPTILQGFARNRYRAVAPRIVHIHQGDREDPRTEWWDETTYSFPKTSLQYDKDDRAPFQIDLDIDEMNASLATARNQVAGIRTFLDRKDHVDDARTRLGPVPKYVDVENVRAAREANIPWEAIELTTGISSRTLRKRLQDDDALKEEEKETKLLAARKPMES